MPFGPFGTVFLDGVQFSTNPIPYEPMNWKKRYSILPAIGGKVTTQDLVTFQPDNTVRLESGPNQFLDKATEQALHTRFRTRGASYVLTDWLGNNFTVFIKSFVPVPFLSGADAAGVAVELYTYRMELQVITIATLQNIT